MNKIEIGNFENSFSEFLKLPFLLSLILKISDFSFYILRLRNKKEYVNTTFRVSSLLYSIHFIIVIMITPPPTTSFLNSVLCSCL